MFSETILGSFLRAVYSGSHPELMRQESAIALASLLLADESITHGVAIQCELRRVLTAIYGDKATWRNHESPVSKDVSAELTQVLMGINHEAHLETGAYIAGLLDMDDNSLIFTKQQRCKRIHSKMLRIFHRKNVYFGQGGANLFIGIIGLKGSGKSSVLRVIEKEGDEVFEVYKELENLKHKNSAKVVSLPPRKDWEDEPLRLVIDMHGVTMQTQRTIFLGSLLRLSELELLSRYGKTVLIHIKSTNATRHTRARSRGRALEKTADQTKMIELDAHRDGLWPTYEQNDLGGLIDACSENIVNDEDASIDDICQRIRNILKKAEAR